MFPDICQMMNCSTEHLSKQTQAWLNSGRVKITNFMAGPLGWFVSTWLGKEENWPKESRLPWDLLHVLRYADANGASAVCFNRNTNLDPNLPWYGISVEQPLMPKHDGPFGTCAMSPMKGLPTGYMTILDGFLPMVVNPNSISRDDLRISGNFIQVRDISEDRQSGCQQQLEHDQQLYGLQFPVIAQATQ